MFEKYKEFVIIQVKFDDSPPTDFIIKFYFMKGGNNCYHVNTDNLFLVGCDNSPIFHSLL